MLSETYYLNMGLSLEDVSEKDLETTNKTIDYLRDNGFDDKKISEMLSELPSMMAVTEDDIPECAWNGSLLKKGICYYHSQLQIVSPRSEWNPETDEVKQAPYYREMKIQYTLQDLINYFYISIPCKFEELKDNNKDEGSMKYLLNYYNSKLKSLEIEAVDFILYLIDEAKNNLEGKSIKILDLNRFEDSTFEFVKKDLLPNSKGKQIIIRR